MNGSLLSSQCLGKIMIFSRAFLMDVSQASKEYRCLFVKKSL